MMKNDYFPNIVGQDIAKRALGFHIDGYKARNIIGHLMFVAPKGCGKTTMAKAVGKNLNETESEKTKKFYEINCSTIKSVAQFFNQLIIPHIHNKECTILFDEASELPKDVTMALLTILNPNAENRTTFSYEDYTVDFDFSQQSFMFATTEAQNIFHALMDRCERVDLEEYTYDELGEIVSRVSAGIKFEDGLLPDIATVLRGNARAAQKMAGKIQSLVEARGGNKFSRDDWGNLCYQLGILPLGLSRIELQILRILANSKECSLTNLAAKTGLTPECIRRDFEMYLQKQSLMEITTAGRSITPDGQDYLKQVEKDEESSKKFA